MPKTAIFNLIRTTAIIGLLALLAGCMYPAEQRMENRVSGLEYITVVQSAIDQYREAKGVLPIKNSEMDTPIYEKYIIDFRKLTDTPYLSQVPPNAFEKGGTSAYVLVDVETDPTVKLMDLVTSQQVNDVQRQVETFMTKHNGNIPTAEPYSAGWHYVDLAEIGMKRVRIQSVYSKSYLNLIVNDTGRVAVDYAPDIVNLLKNQAIAAEPDKDLREYLVEHSPFVPVKSISYLWINDEPVPADKD